MSNKQKPIAVKPVMLLDLMSQEEMRKIKLLEKEYSTELKGQFIKYSLPVNYKEKVPQTKKLSEEAWIELNFNKLKERELLIKPVIKLFLINKELQLIKLKQLPKNTILVYDFIPVYYSWKKEVIDNVEHLILTKTIYYN